MKKLAMIFMAVMIFPALISAAALLEGTVVKVDKSKKEIVLNTDRGQETVDFNDETKGADKVKAGDKAKINFTQKGEKLVANEVVVSRGDSTTSPIDKPVPSSGKEKPPAKAK